MKYSRHQSVIGKEAQKKLMDSSVAVVGVGALGCVAANLLARSGVNLILIDKDVVSVSDLHRQILFDEKDIGSKKVDIAKSRLEKINSDIKIDMYNIDLSSENIKILERCDLILDCTDNLETKFLLNDFAVENKIPLVHGSATKDKGYVFNILPGRPCLNCFLGGSKSLMTCSSAGVLNYLTNVIGSLQVSQAFKILLKENYEKDLIRFDADKIEISKIKVNKKKDCSVCKEP
ncbi:MAG: HesA/MoeB/ThiF family protein [Nanoarchaeota archaeon]|nr:HesA/MoeB/ThiF family protein [Nanoarchaeota archaeon]MCG2718936.1 HesA/MoeB/ThiF family protein [Nanoarchaeota archaeon]